MKMWPTDGLDDICGCPAPYNSLLVQQLQSKIMHVSPNSLRDATSMPSIVNFTQSSYAGMSTNQINGLGVVSGEGTEFILQGSVS